MAKLHLFKKNRAKGTKVFIPGLGEFENGKVHEVDSLEEDVFVPAQEKAKEESESDDEKKKTKTPSETKTPKGDS